MSQDHDYNELVNLLNGFSHFIDKKIQHKKSSDWYVVKAFFFKEDDMTLWFEYETLHRIPIKFARPVTQLFDGRFKIK